MKRRSEPSGDWEDARRQIIGLGEKSVRKSHYPELMRRLSELERFRMLLDHTLDMILMVNAREFKVLDANAAARRRLPALGDGVEDKTLTEVLGTALAEKVLLNADSEQPIEAKCDLSDHDGCPLELMFRTEDLPEGCFGILVIRDIHVRKRYEERLVRQANFDCLTGLPNRSLFEDRLDQAMRQADRNTSQVGVMFIDLDRFKQINDTLGHKLGDMLLVEVADRLRSCVRDQDTVSRLGGDEFTMILMDVVKVADLIIVAEKVLEKLVVPVTLEGHEIVPAASIGIALYPTDGEDSEALMRCSDSAMYKAKNDGRNCFRFFTPELDRQAQRRVMIESHLRLALQRDEFKVLFQPMINLRTHEVIGAEALLRWTNSDLGPVSPAEFIPVAEDIGAIKPIGLHVLKTAIQKAAAWAELSGEFHLSVNVSVRQLEDPDFVSFVESLRGRIPRGVIIHLELTESVLIEDDRATAAILDHIKECGLYLSIDDFGTGYSSLSYLKKFPIDTVKVDRSFIRDASEDENAASLVKAILAMAWSLDLSVVVEGIEEQAHLSFLLRQACDVGQGFYFSRPLTAETFEVYLMDSLDCSGVRHSLGESI